jgi:hypothetical protein
VAIPKPREGKTIARVQMGRRANESFGADHKKNSLILRAFGKLDSKILSRGRSHTFCNDSPKFWQWLSGEGKGSAMLDASSKNHNSDPISAKLASSSWYQACKNSPEGGKALLQLSSPTAEVYRRLQELYAAYPPKCSKDTKKK